MNLAETGIRPFLCNSLDNTLIVGEWGRWIRSLQLYLASDDITNILMKRNKLLHLGGAELQEVAYSLLGAIEPFNVDENNNVFKTLVDKLSKYFSPKQNATFKRHVFKRNIIREKGEHFNCNSNLY